MSENPAHSHVASKVARDEAQKMMGRVSFLQKRKESFSSDLARFRADRKLKKARMAAIDMFMRENDRKRSIRDAAAWFLIIVHGSRMVNSIRLAMRRRTDYTRLVVESHKVSR